MRIINFYLKIILIFFCFSCTNQNVKQSVLTEKGLNQQVIESYEEGVKSLELGDVLYAAQKFNEA